MIDASKLTEGDYKLVRNIGLLFLLAIICFVALIIRNRREKRKSKKNIEVKKIVAPSVEPFRTNIKMGYKVLGVDYEVIKLLELGDEDEIKKTSNQAEKIFNSLKNKDKIFDAVELHNLEEKTGFEIETYLLIAYVTVFNKDGVITTEINEEPLSGLKKIEANINLHIGYRYGKLYQAISKKQTDIEENYNDFIKILMLENKLNYSKAESLIDDGISIYELGDTIIAEKIFDLVATIKTDLQPSTLSNFFRKIGDFYISKENKELALKWYKSGLSINPALGVKRLISQLENK